MTRDEQLRRLDALSLAFHIMTVDFAARQELTLSEAIKLLVTEANYFVSVELQVQQELGMGDGLTRDELEKLTVPLVPQ